MLNPSNVFKAFQNGIAPSYHFIIKLMHVLLPAEIANKSIVLIIHLWKSI